VRVLQLLSQSEGGPADHVVDLSLELCRRGHSVQVVAPTDIARRHREPQDHPLDLAPRYTFVSVKQWPGVLALDRVIRTWQPDLIHCQDRRSGLVGRLLGAARGVPTVYTLHGAPDGLAHLVPNNARVAPTRARDRLMYLGAERTLARLTRSRVVVASEALRTYAREAVGVPEARLDLVPNGIRAAAPAVGHETTHPSSVVWVGLMVQVKRVDLLVDAMALAPQVRVTLVGDGPLRDAVLARADRLGVSGRLEWVGYQDDPAPWLSPPRVAVLCSDAENCPLSLIEAMAHGCAVVATSVGGVPELVRDGHEGLLVPPGDAAALASALSRLGSDHELRGRLARAAAERATQFTVETMTSRLLATYRAALATRPAPSVDA
jgi:glycosyltransferase involved in cell wall biosynthesis